MVKLGLGLGLEFGMEEQPHLENPGLVIEVPTQGFSTDKVIKADRDRHFTNISIEIWVQPLNVNGFLCLLCDLGGILIDYVEVWNRW